MVRDGKAQIRKSSRTSTLPAKGTAREPRSGRRAASTPGGKELLICAALIGVLVLIVTVLYFRRRAQELEHDRVAKRLQAIKEANEERAIGHFQAAERAALRWIQGKNIESPPDLSALSGEQVYNVVLTRRYKDPRVRHEKDQTHKYNQNRLDEVGQKSTPLEGKDGIHLKLAKIGEKEVVIATKNYQGPAEDRVNLGGEILVVVYAVEQL